MPEELSREINKLGIELLEEKIVNGDFDGVRSIIDKNRRQIKFIVEQGGDSPGHLLEKLTRCMANGWIEELLEEGSFSGPLKTESKKGE